LQAMGLANARKCGEAVKLADTLAAPVTGLSFTLDGLTRFLDTPRSRYLLGALYASCAEPEKAARKFSQAAGGRGQIDILWVWAASGKLGKSPDLDSKDRMLIAAGEAEIRAKQRGHESLWHYTAGILWAAAGQPDRANQQLREAFLYPDDG